MELVANVTEHGVLSGPQLISLMSRSRKELRYKVFVRLLLLLNSFQLLARLLLQLPVSLRQLDQLHPFQQLLLLLLLLRLLQELL